MIGFYLSNAVAAQRGSLVLLGNEETGDSEVGGAIDGLNGENAY